MSHPETIRENIQTVIRMETEQDEARSLPDRVADLIGTFAGTVTFVLLHLAFYGAWTAANLGVLPALPAFDPYPFPLLCMLVSMEGVLLSTFVLIKQNRMSRLSDRRNHLDLQINLLTEKEVTKLLQMAEAITERLGIERDDPEAEQLGKETAVEDLAQELDRSIPDRQ